MECGMDINTDPDSTKIALCFENEIYVGEDLDSLIEQVREATGYDIETIASMLQRTAQSFETLGEATSLVEKNMIEFKRLVSEGDVYLPNAIETNHFYDPKRSKKRKQW
jgi:hypothetical protein